MRYDSENSFIKKLDQYDKELLIGGMVGIERECIRSIDGKVSQEKHPLSLGSSLTNNYITTDFSEALIEIITPPYRKKAELVKFLNDIHHFIIINIEEEDIWPMSFPQLFLKDTDIKIADYGSSAKGKFKKNYRKGLAERYGRGMQSIAGIHFNYSYSDELINLVINEKLLGKEVKTKNQFYLNALRNFQRINWLILYLFGSSPFVSSNFAENARHDFSKQKDIYFLKDATTLRMSDIGYRLPSQSSFYVSTRSVEEYIHDLREITEVDKMLKENPNQTNLELLQIEDEYYTSMRLKSSIQTDQRTSAKIINGGVDYLELRSLDIDPFEMNGINKDTIDFIELCFVYCGMISDTPITKDEHTEIQLNDLNVALQGRKNDLKIVKRNKKIKLYDWANYILNDLDVLASFLSSEIDLGKFREKINFPSKTPSSNFLNAALDHQNSYSEFASKMIKENRKHLESFSISENKHWKMLEKEAKESHKKTKKLESQETSYDQFFLDYMDS